MTLRRLTLVLFLALPGTASAASTHDMAYSGGPVMHAVHVHVVNYDTNVNPAYVSGAPVFFQGLEANSGRVDTVFGMLAEYPDSTGPAAQDYSYGESRTIPQSIAQNSTIDSTTIQTTLAARIDDGTLPAPAGDGMGDAYVVMMPPNQHLSIGGASTDQFCAYHGSFAHNSREVIYEVIPDVNTGTLAGGCAPAAGGMSNEEIWIGHETTEVVTDPRVTDGQTAWYNNIAGNGEVGDYCSSQTATNFGHTVQKVWSNAQAKCAATGAPSFTQPTVTLAALPAPTAGQPASFSASGSSTNHAGAIAAGIASYNWTFGDGGTATGAAPSHTYGADGPFTVGVLARDTLGFRASAAGNLSVAPAPPPPAPPPPPKDLAIITLSGKPALKASKGKLVLDTGRTATCPAGAGTCLLHVTVRPKLAGKAAIGAAAKTFGSATIPIAPGHSKRIIIKLAAKPVRKAARKGKVKLVVAVAVERGAQTSPPKAFALTLKLPKH